MKFLFLPFSIAAGLIAGVLSKKLFDGAWRLFDDGTMQTTWKKEYYVLLPALVHPSSSSEATPIARFG